MTKPISPVIVTFKALPGVRVRPYPEPDGLLNCCDGCRLFVTGLVACRTDNPPSGDCTDRNYIWREVPPRKSK